MREDLERRGMKRMGHMVEIFTYPSDTVMSLLAIVNAIENGVDGWLAYDSQLPVSNM